MAKYTYQDSEELNFELLPAGDYAFKIMDAEEGIQTKGKTSGSEFIAVKIAIGKGGKIAAQWTEKVIFHDSIVWKTDGFLRCINFNGGNMAKGEQVEITPETVVGCRGWAHVVVDKYTNASGEEKEINKVGSWLSSKGVLERDMQLAQTKFPVQPVDPFADSTETEDEPF